MLKNTVIALLVIGVFVLVGCGNSDPEKADSIEDIVGTWRRVGGSYDDYCRFSSEGTILCADSVDSIDAGAGPYLNAGTYWFEDTQYFEHLGSCGLDIDGVYEILLLESGNIKFDFIEDYCVGRKQEMIGAFSNEGKIEWEPVP